MRLVLVTERFPAPSETFIVAKVLALLERGLDVQVVCRFSDPGSLGVYGSLQDHDDLPTRVHVGRVGRDVRKVTEAAAPLAASPSGASRPSPGTSAMPPGWSAGGRSRARSSSSRGLSRCALTSCTSSSAIRPFATCT